MLTVIVCLVGSGKRRTRRPLARRYSVIPSTEVTRSAFEAGAAAGVAFAGALPLGSGAAAVNEAASAAARRHRNRGFLDRVMDAPSVSESRKGGILPPARNVIFPGAI